MNNILQQIAKNIIDTQSSNIGFDNEFDLKTFSKDISLFDYQQEALKYGLSVLELYFRDKQKLAEYFVFKGFNQSEFKKEKLTIDKLLNRASF